MRLEKHIAYRFLTDDKFAWEIVDHQHPGWDKPFIDIDGKGDAPIKIDAEGAMKSVALGTYALVNNHSQKAYYITETVIEKLDLLKVGKTSEYSIRRNDTRDIAGTVKTYDWTAFSKSKHFNKVTFIIPDGQVIRIMFDRTFISLFALRTISMDWERNHADIYWTTMWIDTVNNECSENWPTEQVQSIEQLIFKIMCFFYLSDNEEILVLPGHRHGTRKSGKLVNSLKVPITIVNSKWNITSIRTEGFDVSGHFRLQPTNAGPKMIWIDPFRKHGYKRTAKNKDI